MTLFDRALSRGWPIGWFALVLPLAWWALTLAAGGWVPHGDTAITAVRVHDVFGAHSPLLGMPSTSGEAVEGVNAHHPGPLQFQLLAPFHALSGYAPWGLLLGTLVLNAGLLAVALAGAKAAAGTRGWVSVALVQFTIIVLFGTPLAEPWNPWIAAFALAASISAAWAILAGDGRWWPAFAVSVSIAAQSHLALSPLMVVMGVVTLLASILLVRSGRLQLSGRTLALTAVLGVLCWVAPLVDVARHEPDNLDLLLTVAGAGGGGLAVAVVGTAVLGGLLWLAHRRGGGLLSGTPHAIVAWLAVGVVVLAWSATRAGEGRVGYVALGVAVPLTLFSWWVVGAVMRSRRRHTIARVVVALGAIALVLAPRPFGDVVRDRGVLAGDVVDRARLAVQEHDGPLEIRTAGASAWADIGPAVYAAFVADGRTVWFHPRVDGVREDDFRHARHATGTRMRLVVTSHDGTHEPVPEESVVHRVELGDVTGVPGFDDEESCVDLVLTLVE